MAADLPGQSDALEHPAEISAFGEEVAVDLRLLVRIAAPERDGAAGIRLHDRDAQRDRSAGGAVFRRHQVRDGDVDVQLIVLGLA